MNFFLRFSKNMYIFLSGKQCAINKYINHFQEINENKSYLVLIGVNTVVDNKTLLKMTFKKMFLSHGIEDVIK